MYIYQIIDANKRVRLSRTVSSSSTLGTRDAAVHSERYHQLDAYFPFDPYRLPVSKRWVVEDYNEWRGVPGLDRPEVEEAQDSGEEDGEEVLDEGVEGDEGTLTPEEDE